MRLKALLNSRDRLVFKNRALNATERNINVPETWEVYNAVRPIPGHLQWLNNEYGSLFWSAIDPATPDAQELRAQLKELDAVLVTWWTMPRVRWLLQRHYDSMKPGLVDVASYKDEAVWHSFIKFALPNLTLIHDGSVVNPA